MAEGGFDNDNPDFNFDDDEQGVNRTQLFQPGAAASPYYAGEQIA